jgi:hypothetical protein
VKEQLSLYESILPLLSKMSGHKTAVGITG